MADSINCQPCLRDDKETAATVYCYNCAENMCADCQSYHRKSKASSNHKLSNSLEKEKCEELVSIAEECKKSKDDTGEQNASRSVQQTLIEFERCIDACLSYERQNQKTVQDSKLRIKQDLEQVKRQLEETYQTLRKNVLKNTEEIGEKILKSSSNRTDKMDVLKREVTALKLEADTVATHGSSLQTYLHTRHSRQAICNFQESIQILKQEVVSCDIDLKEHKPLTTVIESILNCFKVHEKYSEPDLPSCLACDMPAQYNGRKFHERTATLELETCLSEDMDWPRSCQWIRDYIILASQTRSKLLLYDTTTNTSLSTYQCTNEPWSMTSIDHETFAVCGLDKPIVDILKIDRNQIKLKQSINTKSAVVGLSFDGRNKQLICLSKTERAIFYLRLDGQIMFTVPVGEDLKPDLAKSYCLALDKRTQIIYISCCDSGKVLAITKEGEKLGQLTHVDSVALSCPWEVTVDADSNVYICIMHSQYVLQCDKDLNVIKKLLQENTPLGISFNKVMSKIALTGNFNSGWLKVYKLE
ncbi:uncharacterized protein LOC128548764 [Mercenaria mercenaria]|uniref:uncharacterized protein LOC128548764 n=1 Tax=Mercenaria mercenaria TaxID=6596 RepID=UPI00234FB183|nr:uncharacterized protein LOC128548764 [Mercenaria mercenaria]